MNDRLARDVELILLMTVYVAIVSILCYASLTISQARFVTYAEELMFKQMTYLAKGILSLFR